MADDRDWLAQFNQRARADLAGFARLPIPDADIVPRRHSPRAIPRRLWVYWAQGWENAPPQSQLCVASWRRHNADWTVTALDDRTIADFVDLGDLLDGKDITVTGRSNLVRMHLLARYGGVWADASTFCSQPLSQWLPPLMQSGFFAFARPGPDRILSTWFLAAEPANAIVLRWQDLLARYWRATDRSEFYHWTHYLFAEGCRSDPQMNALWHATPWVSADGPHDVQAHADDPQAADVLASLAEGRVPVHKLETRRPSLPMRDAGTPLAHLLHDTKEAAVSMAPERQPRVSVVMTVYNDLRFLDEAVTSILNQDFEDLELVVVDDGTGQPAVFDDLVRRDPRVRLVVNPSNLGTAAAANRGIEVARADIIVRLDADDVAEPSRIRRLVAALDDDPTLGLVGSWVTFIDETGRTIGVQPMPVTDIEIRWTILFHNPFFHSAVAFRREHFEAAGRYKIDEMVSQDHFLWFHMLPLCRAANLPAPLTRYRINSKGLTITHQGDNPRKRTHCIRETLWTRMGLTYDLHDNARAREVTDFLRGNPIAASERRLPAYRVMLDALPAFLAAPRPSTDGDAARLTRMLVTRMLDAPPSSLPDTVALWWHCWRIDWRWVLATIDRRWSRRRERPIDAGSSR